MVSVCSCWTAAHAAEKTYAPFDPAMQVGAHYVIAAEKLHPTQFALGFREVRFKRDKFNGLSRAELTKALKKKDVPVVIGPGGVPFMADGHHTIRALLESNHADKTVYGTVIANWAGLSPDEFWRRMAADNYTNLTDERGQSGRDPGDLPTTLRAMKSDPYRGLGWAVMEAGGFDERKEVYFQEFRWADFFRTRVKWDDASDADFARAVREAVALAHGSDAAGLPGYR